MTKAEFNIELEELIASIKNKLTSKGKEYATEYDVFTNFEKDAQILGVSSERVLDGYLTKHYVSYRDILADIDKGLIPNGELIDEELGDIITYFILQKIMMKVKYSF